jgi:predicted alpha/beta-hydrolase family hydrolase
VIPKPVTIALDTGAVSGLLLVPDQASACYVMAHGAGAGMHHPFMATVAEGLAARNIATLRFQFPFIENGSKRADKPAVAQIAVRKTVALARLMLPNVPLFAGGKSFGGRMTSQAQALEPLPGVVGLVFLGFPLHPVGKPSVQRADHLSAIDIPMLFLQGTRDALAEMELLVSVVAGSKQATLSVIENGDHSFQVPVRSGNTDQGVMEEMLDVMAAWVNTTNAHTSRQHP